MSFSKIIGLFALSAMVASCAKEEMNKKPELTIESLTWRDAGHDTININFSFKDGDADIDHTGILETIFMRDPRVPIDSQNFVGFPLAPFDGGILDPKKGVTGKMQIQYSTFYPPNNMKDSGGYRNLPYKFEMYMKDKANNESVHVTTPELGR